VVLAAFAAVLHVITAVQEIVIGSAILKRSASWPALVGAFENPVACDAICLVTRLWLVSRPLREDNPSGKATAPCLPHYCLEPCDRGKAPLYSDFQVALFLETEALPESSS